jgi:hypothetical protein
MRKFAFADAENEIFHFCYDSSREFFTGNLHFDEKDKIISFDRKMDLQWIPNAVENPDSIVA